MIEWIGEEDATMEEREKQKGLVARKWESLDYVMSGDVVELRLGSGAGKRHTHPLRCYSLPALSFTYCRRMAMIWRLRDRSCSRAMRSSSFLRSRGMRKVYCMVSCFSIMLTYHTKILLTIHLIYFKSKTNNIVYNLTARILVKRRQLWKG